MIDHHHHHHHHHNNNNNNMNLFFNFVPEVISVRRVAFATHDCHLYGGHGGQLDSCVTSIGSSRCTGLRNGIKAFWPKLQEI